jgi:hypothetical protein
MGKTLEALMIALRFSDGRFAEKMGIDFPLMIVCPKQKNEHWRDQISQWCQNLKPEAVTVVNDPFKTIDINKLIFIMSYDIVMKMFSEKKNKKLIKPFKCFIIDEAQNFKNPSVSN